MSTDSHPCFEENLSLADLLEGDLTDLGDSNIEPTLLENSSYINNLEFKDLLKEKSKNLKILSLNCQSLNAKFELLKIYLDYFNESNDIIDAICLQETWLTEDSDLSLLKLPGYNLISKGRSCSAHGGVCIYLKENYDYTSIDIDIVSDFWDGQMIEILVKDINGTNKKVVIGNFYRPPRPTHEDIKTFIKDMNAIFDKLKNFKNVVLTGDFNINLLNFKIDSSVDYFIDNLMSNGYLPKITIPTRLTQRKGTLIDNFFVKFSESLSKTTAKVLKSKISDHLPYFISLDYLNCKRCTDKYIKIHTSYPQQFENFKNDFENLETKTKLNNVLKNNPNDSCNSFIEIITNCLDKHFPCKLVKFNKYKHKKSKWITNAIIKSIKYKDRLYIKLKSLSLNSNSYHTSLSNFKTYSKILKQTIQTAKKLYYENCFHTFKTDMKKTWSTINDIINKAKNTSQYPKEFTINNTSVSDVNCIANEFNKYFIEVGPKLSRNIESPRNKSFKDFLKSPVQAIFKFKLIGVKQVIEAIDSLKPKTSHGQDRITNKLLKYIKNEAAWPLTQIINQIFQHGVFPDSMKIAKVMPLYKKNEKNLFCNYRPVSILSSVSKVFEKIMHNQIYEHFEKLNILYPNQYGFRKNHSTEYAAMELVERIINEMDKNNMPINIFMDLSKAFDTLDHGILFHKLEYYGFKGPSLELMKCYLSNRTQYVELDNVKSDPMKISCGVPQGSILGPLLFIIYLNDLPSVTKKLKTLIYADDTTLFATLNNTNFATIEKKINNELKSICNWLKLNKLSLNIEKTKAMLFHTTNKHVKCPDIYIDAIKIDFTDEFNFLGLILDKNLNWKSHVNFIGKKISKTVGIMTKLKNFLPVHALYNIYNALILPHLNYCSSIWGWQSHNLFKIQKKAIRIITKSRYNAHTNKLFKELNTLKINDICALHDYKFLYKIINGLVPTFFANILGPQNGENHEHDTRNASDIRLPAVRHEFARNGISYRFSKIFNKMPNDFKEKIYTSSQLVFKFYIKQKIIENYPTTCTIRHCPNCSQLI